MSRISKITARARKLPKDTILNLSGVDWYNTEAPFIHVGRGRYQACYYWHSVFPTSSSLRKFIKYFNTDLDRLSRQIAEIEYSTVVREA